ncbi:hypothetical protein [Pseudooceanicola sp. LIPI14-2-Ac024]|uniref:hypothetical protein n=1 Tax=Pseudooceanicola sp. LIPI14-2-Ac024 TaxID=3344875 RepID=UPI0035D02581
MLTEYLTLATAPNRARDVATAIAALPRTGPAAGIEAGFTAMIGGSINALHLLLRAGDATALDAAAQAILSVDGALQVTRQPLTPVQERNLPALAPDGAMYTNRWFHVRDAGTDAFEADTLAAWDAFEAGTDTQVVGLWKAPAQDGVTAHLLIARYADLAAWDASRFWNRGAEDQTADWVERFRRRREQMTDSSVIATTCLFGPAR